MNLKTLNIVNYSIVQSILTYGIVGWGGAALCYIKPLTTVQKSIMKVIIDKPLRNPTESLFQDFKVMDIRQFYVPEILKIFRETNNYVQDREHRCLIRNRNLMLLERSKFCFSGTSSTCLQKL